LGRFVADVTIPDGTAVSTGQNFFKIWKMRNEGTGPWPEGTRLEFVGGDKLSQHDSVPIPTTAAGEEVEIAVDMTAPAKQGRYVSYWRLTQADGTRFGQRVWVDIIVAADNPTGNNTASQEAPVAQTTPAEAPQSMEVETPKATEPSQPVTAPSAPPVESTPAPQPTPTVSPQVQQLVDMGFSDTVLIEKLLKKNNNDVIRTVQDLLNFQK